MQKSMPLKIAVGSQIFCSQIYGGVSRYLTQLAIALDAQGQAVRIFAPLHRNQYLEQLPEGLVMGRWMPYCPPRSKRFLVPVNALLSSYPIRAWKPDVIHDSYYAKNGIRRDSTPTIVTVYDMVHELFPGNFSRLDNTSRIKRAAVERASHVICISESTRRDLIDLWKIPAEKTSVIHLGFDKLESDVVTDTGLSRGKPFILYVANRYGYKNFECLVQAFAMSERLQRDFRIIAFGGGDFSSREKKLTSKLGIGKANLVHMTGGDKLLATVYSAASVFVYPSFYEGFGLSPLEAMGQGCPVISSNASCLPEVLGKAADFFRPDSPEELMHAMEAMLYDQERSEMFRRRGYLQVKGYSWEACARATLSVYESVVDNRS